MCHDFFLQWNSLSAKTWWPKNETLKLHLAFRWRQDQVFPNHMDDSQLMNLTGVKLCLKLYSIMRITKQGDSFQKGDEPLFHSKSWIWRQYHSVKQASRCQWTPLPYRPSHLRYMSKSFVDTLGRTWRKASMKSSYVMGLTCNMGKKTNQLQIHIKFLWDRWTRFTSSAEIVWSSSIVIDRMGPRAASRQSDVMSAPENPFVSSQMASTWVSVKFCSWSLRRLRRMWARALLIEEVVQYHILHVKTQDR